MRTKMSVNLLFFFVLALLATVQRTAGVDEDESEEDPQYKYPFLVGIETSRYDEPYFCTGSLISVSHVLTSAHCVSSANSFKLIFGIHNLTSDDEEGRVEIDAPRSAAILHPKYVMGLFRFNIAIIKLDDPVPIDGTTIKPIDLVSSDSDNLLPGSMAKSIGWGHCFDLPISDTPEFTNVTVWPNRDCQAVFRYIGPSNICVSGCSSSKFVSDAGGPLIIGTPDDPELIGVNSLGLVICSCSYPAIFERVTSHLSWIEETLADSDIF